MGATGRWALHGKDVPLAVLVVAVGESGSRKEAKLMNNLPPQTHSPRAVWFYTRKKNCQGKEEF